MTLIRQYYAPLLCLSGLFAVSLAMWNRFQPIVPEGLELLERPQRLPEPITIVPYQVMQSAWVSPEPLPPLPAHQLNYWATPPFIIELFSPPKLFIESKSNQWTLNEYPPKEPDFGLRLKQMAPHYYRYDYQGFIKNSPYQSEADYTVILKDRETGDSLLGAVGEALPETSLTIVSLNFLNEGWPNGSVDQHVQVTLSDRKLEQTLVLSNRQPRALLGVDLHLYFSEAPQRVLHCYQVGDTLRSKDVLFTIRAIDKHRPSITVEKHCFGSDRKVLKKLFPHNVFADMHQR